MLVRTTEVNAVMVKTNDIEIPPLQPRRGHQIVNYLQIGNQQVFKGGKLFATDLVYDRLALKQLLIAIIHISGEKLDARRILFLMRHIPQRNDISIQYCLIQS